MTETTESSHPGSNMKLTSRGKLLLLIGVFALPVIAAGIAYLGWRPSAHGNYGELLEVKPLQATTGMRLDGQAFDMDSLRGKWLMVHIGSGGCDAACAYQLYLSRQVRTAQGKDQSRIERLWILSDGRAPEAALMKMHPGLIVWRPVDRNFLAQFPRAGAANQIYLVDPLGNLMMRFPVEPDPKRMMKDLRLLLKASQIG